MNRSEAALTGAIIGGIIDGSNGDDSIIDGVIIGALAGSLLAGDDVKQSPREKKESQQAKLAIITALFVASMIMFSLAVFMNGSALSALEQFITKDPLNKAPLEDVMSLGVVAMVISFGFLIIRRMLKNDLQLFK
jgi:hypothetical protein